MGERGAKDALFAEFAAVGKALGNPKRLELLDLLAQGPRSVEDLANAAEVGVSTCSAHLQTLREAGLVGARRDGKRIYYSLAADDVAGLWEHLRRVAQQHRPHTELARRAYLGPEDTAAVDTDELLRRLDAGETLVLDVRPDVEYAGGHLPGAVHIPLEELEQRLSELPRDRDIVAYCRGQYCVLAHDAVRLLASHGLTARRAADGVLEWRVAGIPVQTGAA
ncbi:MAG TPA: metalloregulator ArsR/SmtB family transcription factor [Dermatophilaceae bacterium]|jgi:rhodanese-related sulfurtransferase|nr:metalloregulator ArsR/SmtB family transcription factor [Dermatophilaceae bacterium]